MRYMKDSIYISITLHVTVSKDIDNPMHCFYLLLICISFKVPFIKYNFIFSKTTFINKYICIDFCYYKTYSDLLVACN